ncbi:hypothetical protein [Desulfofustis glycolicus]|uniref:TubC N-terminal docking domain-containing protein n=1 Tax=Desulfofustis glycolicus DSM 9705 TaxID=1121409 RepID=A0A1M5XPU7_9BACT|nr:hypothetical protein [Desulfofustis glycolicus]SHI01865.1 hypothetical protein SAMN02745124_03238 [Desulfofustis glycolicus DSM 9705]
MSAAEDILSDSFNAGIVLTVEGNGLHYAAAEPLPQEMAVRLRSHKEAVIDILTRKRTGVPYLHSGEFRVRGGLLQTPVLDALLSVGASDAEIEKHIHPKGTPRQWARWQEIKKQGAFLCSA